MAELTDRSLVDLAGGIARGECSAREATDAFLERAARLNEQVNAYLVLDEAGARRSADAVDAARADGRPLGPLAGVPLALKDIFVTEDLPTTCASHILEGFQAPYDATVVRRLREAGAVVLGKTNLDEFAMGSSNENSAFGPVRNPWDLGRVTGGSSGGSAAAVAARMAAGALGTDTGGSIRQPASLCGCVGLKPTYGRASRYGMVAFASSLDQAGPMTRTVADAARLAEVICGHDPRDSTSLEAEVAGWADAVSQGVDGLRVAVPREYFREGLDPEVERVVRKVLDDLDDAGAQVSEVSLPHSEYAVATYYIVATAEASSNLARYDGVRYGLRVSNDADLGAMYRATRAAGFGTEVKRRILLGTYVLSEGYYDAYYRKAMQVRTLIRKDFEDVFAAHDVIVGPVSPTAAWELGAKMDDPLSMYLSDIYTIAINLAGLPGVSVPAGVTGDGLPVGVQLVGGALQEATLFRAAGWVERESAPDLGPPKGVD